MLKEILKGNKNPSKEKTAEKKQRNRRINSVLNNFDLFKKINLNKKTLQKKDKVNSNKLIIKNNSKKMKQKQINSNELTTSPYSRNKNNNLLINNSCSFKSCIDKLNSISNFKSYNFDTYEYIDVLNDKNLVSSYNLRNNEIEEKENQNGNQTLYERKSNVYLNSAKNNSKLFTNNLEQEFEIRCLKKKLKNLKNKNRSLIQQLDNIKKKNNIIETEMVEEQNKRKDIIFSFINICNDIFNNEEDDDESNRFKNILLNLMDLKFKYENIFLENEFISNVDTLFSLSNIFNDNFYDNKRNNKNNNLYHNIKNIIKLKTKYLNSIKKYKLLLIKNKKYFEYCSDLLKEFNLNDLDTLYNNLKNIKSINDKETRKFTRMKKVLFNSINNNSRRRNINKSVDNLKKLKKYPINFNFNFNYSDLQKYFIEHNKNKKHIKERFMSLKTEKSDCLTEREKEKQREREKEEEEEGDEEGSRLNIKNVCNNTTKNESRNINYFLGGNIKSLRNISKDISNYKKMCKIKNYVKNVDKIKHLGIDSEKEKGSKSLFFTSIIKTKEAPYNNILIKKNNQNINFKNIINSKAHTYSNETKSEEKNNNFRLNKYYNHGLTNKLNNTINTNIINVKSIFKNNLKENSNKRKNKSEKNNSYNNKIKIKKKSLNIKANKNYY